VSADPEFTSCMNELIMSKLRAAVQSDPNSEQKIKTSDQSWHLAHLPQHHVASLGLRSTPFLEIALH
jgi:hypothetical protein